ncbi:amidase [Amycolatopsis magusensis]|uniref:Asp-tRNA(Asn)/Glu-tRNA(Gln) amidotransferase A subunit family amidase n=1 Tax=Amycolatopsis magusensis TaxID=882444 RepID=A0ABS4Q0X6_9PSEU|nr:amidase [Amycolatopsis magusensis]MBP2185314.1 Asp-tRNA(Asn)/Glu-tRNA(Gln) amidotransferase A subunit family amidase [Amycolatopsis magusensis]
MDDYPSYDAVGLAALVRDGQATPADLLEAARARLERVNPRLNAVVRAVDPPAAASDGPFAGVPFLLKDLHQDLAGLPTSSGSRSMVSVPAEQTATVVQRWLDAGLVVFGKTNTPEFGAKGITEPELFGPARNPWNTEHTPGGSSGGAAAAVAAGVVPCAGASDGGGSIRIPASACGLFGLKPSRGLIPAGPARAEGLGGTATDGVISRSVRDTAAMLDVLAGPTTMSPYLAAGPATPFADEAGLEPGRLRIGLCTASAINPNPHPEAVAAARAAGDLLDELGHEVVELPSQPFDDATLAKDFLTSWFVSCAHSMADCKAVSGASDSAFELDTRTMAALGRATDPVDLLRAIERRHEHTRRLAEFHESYDFLLTPATATPPPKIGAFDTPAPVRVAQRALLTVKAAGLLRHTPLVDQLIHENLSWVPYTQLANLTGRPAMSVPLHWTAGGLPIGAQFVGRLGADGALLRLAAQLEQARPWADRRPALT